MPENPTKSIDAPRSDAEPQAALYSALEAHAEGDLTLVDFDETLWLRNSTEEFLASIRPQFLGALIVQLLGILKPWRWSRQKGPDFRDWWRVAAAVMLAPWSLWLWRRRAPEMGRRYQNGALLGHLRAHGLERTKVVTYGFDFIVKPLLEGIDPQLDLAVASRLQDGAQLRVVGKAAAIEARFGAEALRRSLVITDSALDNDLLSRSGKPFLVEWPEARYDQAGLKPLMPFVYLKRVKRPDESYFTRSILGHDYAVAFLCFVVVNPHPIMTAVSLLLFLLSFFTAYEIGYHENDKLGAQYEAKPKISKAFWTMGQNFSPAFAWWCAVVIAGLAALIGASASWVPAALNLHGLPAVLVVWAAFVALIALVRAVFYAFNTLQPRARITPMLALQVLRVLGYGVVFATTIAGALFCIAHALSRWIPYVVYRYGGDRREMQAHLLSFLIFSALLLALLGSQETAVDLWHTGIILAYLVGRAAKDVMRFSAMPEWLRLRR